MALTPSTMLPLGTPAPAFTLRDTVSGKVLSLENLTSTLATVIVFMCNHCPYVKHIQKKLVAVAHHYQHKGISFIAISSNDVDHYPDDSPEKMKEEAQRFGYPFPYLYDETQQIAHAYHAACTPDFYVFDKALKCVYRGRFDNSSPGKSTPITGHDLRAALDALLAGKPIGENQLPSMGCNIKWKSQ
ncbi:MAG TPA: thioredoxin family protein [Coxiellaceae bacterium]|nr:thioredoxin family protein [Coxiellaceae bacterium]